MTHHRIARALRGAVLLLLTVPAIAQVPPEPPPCPDPTLVVHLVELKGVVQDGECFQFFEDGTWANWDDDQVYGWGTYEWNPVAGTIDYVNLSGDGGGNQTGTYTWDPDEHVWERTASSHPNAPPMSLLPPW